MNTSRSIITLNYWQTVLLFVPALAGCVIEAIPTKNLFDYQSNFAIANVLTMFNLCIVILYQTYLNLSFNKTIIKKSTTFVVNTLIPLAFLTLYFLYIIFFTFIKPTIHNPKYVPGPIKKADFNPTTWVIFILLIHAGITFFYINKLFISERIKKITDKDERTRLTADFLMPTTRLINVSIGLIAFMMLIFFVIDIFSFS